MHTEHCSHKQSVKLLAFMRGIKTRIQKITLFAQTDFLQSHLNFFHELVVRLMNILREIQEEKGIYMTTIPLLSEGNTGISK